MSFPAYPSYRDSGDIALGDIPTHWAVTRVKDVVDIINGYPFDSKAFDAADGRPLLRIRDLGASDAEVRYRGEVPDGFEVTRRDVLIGMDGDFNVGRWMGSEPALLNQRVCALRTKSQVLSTLLEHALVAPLKRINALTYSTTVKHLSSYQVGSIKLALPSDENELSQLAAFLDRETAKIDALVEEQRRLIELLKEKRQAVISHAVTKGLDPTVPMKDSGVEWLGQVPAHWEVKRLRHVITALGSGTSVNASDVPASGDEIGVLKTSCVYSGAFDASENKTVIVEDLERVSCPVKRGCLIVSRMNTPELVGAAGLVTSEHPNIYLPDRLWQIEFGAAEAAYVDLWTASASYRAQVRVACDGTSSSMQNLSQDKFYGFIIAMPPRSEQRQIVAQLRQQLGQMDALGARAEQAVGILQERRGALISAAVTGKIDVRNTVAKQAIAA